MNKGVCVCNLFRGSTRGASMLGALPAKAQETEAISVNLEVAAEGLTAPLLLRSAPDDTGRSFIIELIGTIRILEEDGTLRGEPFLNIRHKLIDLKHDFDERGLLGLAFHLDFAENGRFYVYFSGQIRDDACLNRYLWYSHTKNPLRCSFDHEDGRLRRRRAERL